MQYLTSMLCWQRADGLMCGSYIYIIMCIFIWTHRAEHLNTGGGPDKWEETIRAVRTVHPRLG